MGSDKIKIADREVSMEDIFKRPEMVRKLKEYEEVLVEILKQITDIRRRGNVPEVLLVDSRTFTLIREYGINRYWPTHKQQIFDGNDRFMNLIVAITSGESHKQYIKVK